MTRIIVNSGACGFTVTVTVRKNKDGKMAVTLDTQCEMVNKMLGDLAVLDRYAPLAGLLNNPVHKSAAKHLKHAACPVPSGILKALEVEAGLNVAKDAVIKFVEDKDESV
jgi:hypothetical protein